MDDLYAELGVSKDATADEIKKAYRKLAKKYHPDLNPGDKTAEQNFKEVNEAYDVLSDKTKKARYDQFGHAGTDPNYGGGGAGGYSYYGGNPFGDDFDLGDIFSSFFGGFGGGRSRSSANIPRRGTDVECKINITFLEAAKGCTKKVAYYCIENCDECGGTGAKKALLRKHVALVGAPDMWLLIKERHLGLCKQQELVKSVAAKVW